MTRAAWRKSSRSNDGQRNSCVEVARGLPGAVAVRDSKDPDGPVLTLGPAGWMDFIADLKAGGWQEFIASLKAGRDGLAQPPGVIGDGAWWPPSPFV